MLVYNYFTHAFNNVLSRQLINMKTHELLYIYKVRDSKKTY